MPSAPKPITSTPPVPGQPYNAADPGTGATQTQPETVYNAAGGAHAAEPWVKIADGGAIDMSTGAARAGDWPADGSSDGRVWKQT
jgi:hypothetical protein